MDVWCYIWNRNPQIWKTSKPWIHKFKNYVRWENNNVWELNFTSLIICFSGLGRNRQGRKSNCCPRLSWGTNQRQSKGRRGHEKMTAFRTSEKVPGKIWNVWVCGSWSIMDVQCLKGMNILWHDIFHSSLHTTETIASGNHCISKYFSSRLDYLEYTLLGAILGLCPEAPAGAKCFGEAFSGGRPCPAHHSGTLNHARAAHMFAGQSLGRLKYLCVLLHIHIFFK